MAIVQRQFNSTENIVSMQWRARARRSKRSEMDETRLNTAKISIRDPLNDIERVLHRVKFQRWYVRTRHQSDYLFFTVARAVDISPRMPITPWIFQTIFRADPRARDRALRQRAKYTRDISARETRRVAISERTAEKVAAIAGRGAFNREISIPANWPINYCCHIADLLAFLSVRATARFSIFFF